MAWLGIWFGISNNCGICSYGVGQNWETNEESKEDWVEETFQQARVKIDTDGEEAKEVLGMGYCSIEIWDWLELKLAWSGKNNSYFENCFPIFLLSGN